MGLRSGAVEEVVFHAQDGWELHGDLLLPAAGESVPGIVLLHSGRTDRAVFGALARVLVRRGLAVLNLDWRGRGQSTNKGTRTYDLHVERADGRLDAAAALDVLAARPEVDGTRLATLGVAHGAEHAVRGALGDPRVRAIVVLTGFYLAEGDDRRRLLAGDVDVLYVTGDAHRATADAMRELYEQSKGRRTRFVEVPGGAIGYQLLELHPWLTGEVSDWLVEVLASAEPAEAGRRHPVLQDAPGSAGSTARRPGVVLVPARVHDRDAYGPAMVDALAAHGLAAHPIDGRGRDVAADVAAATAGLAGPVAVVAEQDAADAAAAAAVNDAGVAALVLLSPRFAAPLPSLSRLAVLAIASKEDRRGLRGAVDAFLAGDRSASRLELGQGLGFGATMFSARAFEQPDEERFETLIARWLAEQLAYAASR